MLEAFLSAPLPRAGTTLSSPRPATRRPGARAWRSSSPQLAFDAAIIGEPNDFAVAVSQKGLVKLKLTARGRSGHAARPHLADNAIVRAARDVLAIEGLDLRPVEDPLLGKPTAAVTMIEGGIKSNVVPDRCELTVDASTIGGFDNDAMIAAVRGAVSSQVEVLSARLKPVAGDPASRIARAALAATGAAGVTGFPSVSDLAHVGGKPAIVFGPGRPRRSRTAPTSRSRSVEAARGAGRVREDDRELLLVKRRKRAQALWGAGYAGATGRGAVEALRLAPLRPAPRGGGHRRHARARPRPSRAGLLTEADARSNPEGTEDDREGDRGRGASASRTRTRTST